MSTTPTARDTVFAPLLVEGAVERIVRRLGEAIGSGVLQPGERLPPEVELAERLDVAPMTLRQALAILRDAGYVETRRGRGAGTFVVDDIAQPLGKARRIPTHEELRDLVDWRRAIAGETAYLAAARADAGARQRIADAAARAEASAFGDFAGYRLADSGFHLAVAEETGSARLVAAETAIQAEFGEILGSLPGSESTAAVHASTMGHTPILAAILQGDAPAARDAMVAHVEATYDWIIGLHLGRLAARA
ncbi:MAG: FadR/GntR family transcriptional regulator [Gaiellales bacterium]